MSRTNAERKIALVEQLVGEAWVRIAAARDVILLSEERREEYFCDNEVADMGDIADRLVVLNERMRAISLRPRDEVQTDTIRRCASVHRTPEGLRCRLLRGHKGNHEGRGRPDGPAHLTGLSWTDAEARKR
jgi:hypothetical protein